MLLNKGSVHFITFRRTSAIYRSTRAKVVASFNASTIKNAVVNSKLITSKIVCLNGPLQS